MISANHYSLWCYVYAIAVPHYNLSAAILVTHRIHTAWLAYPETRILGPLKPQVGRGGGLLWMVKILKLVPLVLHSSIVVFNLFEWIMDISD